MSEKQFDYWAWAKTAPRCEGCGIPFDPNMARLMESPDHERLCCLHCATETAGEQP